MIQWWNRASLSANLPEQRTWLTGVNMQCHALCCTIHTVTPPLSSFIYFFLCSQIGQFTEWLIQWINHCLFPSPNVCLLMNAFKILNDVPPCAWPRKTETTKWKVLRQFACAAETSPRLLCNSALYFVVAAIYRHKQTNKSHLKSHLLALEIDFCANPPSYKNSQKSSVSHHQHTQRSTKD